MYFSTFCTQQKPALLHVILNDWTITSNHSLTRKKTPQSYVTLICTIQITMAILTICLVMNFIALKLAPESPDQFISLMVRSYRISIPVWSFGDTGLTPNSLALRMRMVHCLVKTARGKVNTTYQLAMWATENSATYLFSPIHCRPTQMLKFLKSFK